MLENERMLQPAVHKLMSDPSRIYKTQSGKRLQILSPGRHNVHEGPDFLEIAILLDGMLLVGDCEFHKKSSDWDMHNHSIDQNFSNVILHIILDNDKDCSLKSEVFVLDDSELKHCLEETASTQKIDINSIDALQQFALIRLLRKTSEASKLLEYSSIGITLTEMSRKFLEHYNKKRRRPIYDTLQIGKFIQHISDSIAYDFLLKLSEGNDCDVHHIIFFLLKKSLMNEGKALRYELMMNALLPIAIALSNEEKRIDLFLWYWSTKSINKYGILNRRFPDISQQYIWQQQGMLEYLKEYGNKEATSIREDLKSYSFGDMLSFYKFGSEAIEHTKIEI